MTAPRPTPRPMRVLLAGGDGQLGRALRAALSGAFDVVATTRAELDLRDADAIRRVVRSVAPGAIVNAAAWTAVDDAERRRDDAWAVNATAPGVLATEAARLGAVLVHYSTDYVFDGAHDAPYREDDATRPLGVYGASKLAGERAIADAGARALVLRTSWLYSAWGRSFFGTMLRLAADAPARGTPVRVVSDQRGAPTSCAFVADATARLLADARLRAPAADAAYGVYHLTARGDTTWHGFAAAIFAGAAARGVPAPTLEAIPTSAYPTPAARPRYSVLDTSKVARAFGIVPPTWQEQLDRVLDERFGAVRADAWTPEPMYAHHD